MKRPLRRKVYRYTAVFEPDPDNGGFTATVPTLPGWISEGDTYEKAVENISEAAGLYLEVSPDSRPLLPLTVRHP